MIIRELKQGTPEWHQVRLGMPTGSNFEKIVTPTGALSKQSAKYMYKLIAERIMGIPFDSVGTIGETVKTQWMQRGSEMEPEAVNSYIFATGNTCTEVGFILDPSGRYGASPDRLVGDTGLLEVKCPKWDTHIGYLLTDGLVEDYRPQCQGELLVSGLEFVDMISHCPPFPDRIIRVLPDAEYQKRLRDALETFCDQLEASYQQLVNGYGEFAQPKPREADEDLFGITEADLQLLIEDRFGGK